MTKIFPRTEYSDDIRINVFVGIRCEDFVWCNLSPGDKFIEKAVWRDASVRDGLLCGIESHAKSPSR
jgi:hypothetical protein